MFFVGFLHDFNANAVFVHLAMSLFLCQDPMEGNWVIMCSYPQVDWNVIASKSDNKRCCECHWWNISL